jgi:hypothetical protein
MGGLLLLLGWVVVGLGVVVLFRRLPQLGLATRGHAAALIVGGLMVVGVGARIPGSAAQNPNTGDTSQATAQTTTAAATLTPTAQPTATPTPTPTPTATTPPPTQKPVVVAATAKPTAPPPPPPPTSAVAASSMRCRPVSVATSRAFRPSGNPLRDTRKNALTVCIATRAGDPAPAPTTRANCELC